MRLAIILAWFLAALTPTAVAQTDVVPIDRLVIQEWNGDLYFYNANADGQLTLLTTLTDFLLEQGPGFSSGEWRIFQIPTIAVSPDGRHVAFTASGPGWRAALFLYTVGEPELHPVEVPGEGTLKWSPDSQTILLCPAGLAYNGSSRTVRDYYLYDLAADTVTLFAPLPNTAWNAWLPDSSGLIGHTTHCIDYLCTDELIVIDRDGQNPRQLTDTRAQLPPNLAGDNLWCGIRNPVWSAASARFYYVLRCDPSGTDWYMGHDNLYSVSLESDNRLELNLSALYPGDENFHLTIHAIHPTRGGLIETVVEREYVRAGQMQVDVQLFQLTAPKKWEIIYSTSESSGFTFNASALSEPYLALSDGGYDSKSQLTVINLDTHTTAAWNTPYMPLILEWLAPEILQYTEYSGNSRAYLNAPEKSRRLNVNTGAFTTLFPGLQGAVWVLPRQ
ncbi:MAG TPA: hypothetical protein VHP83_26620 [Aggregatilineaceae bacterium]|nr:hypothetical protein [Aggregatilineaceae bacterium]